MSADERSELERAACPRCGYDLSGEVSRWESRCPLEGLCPECGLGVDWGEVLNPRLAVPRWSFEHAGRWKLLALSRTWCRAVLPWRLWRLGIATPIVGWALAVFVVVSLGLGHAAAGIGAGLDRYAGSRWRMGSVPTAEAIGAGLVAYERIPGYRFGRRSGGPLIWAEALGVLLLPVLTAVAYLPLAQTFGRMRLRRAHLARGAAYWYASVAPAFVVLTLGWMHLEGTFWWWNPPRWVWTVSRIELVGLMGIVGGVWLVWHAAYWRAFTGRYLRLPHAWGVTAAVVATGLLADLVVLVLVYIMAVAVRV